jgi:TonB family protein
MQAMTYNRPTAYFYGMALLAGLSSGVFAAASPDVSVIGVAVDYPSRALRESRQGTVFFTVVVGPEGKPKSCTVTTSSGHADLDYAACQRAMRAGRFASAVTDSENQVDRSFSSKAEFKISE